MVIQAQEQKSAVVKSTLKTDSAYWVRLDTVCGDQGDIL